MLKYIKHQQRKLENKKKREAEVEAKKEAARIAKAEAEARKQKEIAEQQRLFLEQQESKRLRQKRMQQEEINTREKWDKQLDILLNQIEERQQREKDKLAEIRIIIQSRDPSLQELDWAAWLADPLNQRLADLDFNHAMELFKRDNLLAKRRKGGGRRRYAAATYYLSFTGDTNVATRRGDLVATDFNPDDFSLATNGFTISYWVRPDEVGADMFAIGRKAHNNERFTFGIARGWKGYFGVGANQSERAWETMLDTAGIDKATHLVQDTDDEWILVVGRWYHFAVTYADRSDTSSAALRKVYMNGQQIWGTGVSDPSHAGNINWSQTGTEMDGGLSFGMRAVRGSGTNTNYNNGWACGLDEVAIFDEEKDSDWVSATYNNGVPNNLKGQSGLVGYWRFEEGSGTTVEDLSGNGNHGTLTNDTLGADGGAAWVDATDTPTWSTDIP